MIASNLVTTSLRENVHIKDFCILSAYFLNSQDVKSTQSTTRPSWTACIAGSLSTDGLVKTWEIDGAATKERVARFWLQQIDKTQKSSLLQLGFSKNIGGVTDSAFLVASGLHQLIRGVSLEITLEVERPPSAQGRWGFFFSWHRVCIGEQVRPANIL